METKYAYEKLMAEHKLTTAELPADAQMGIKSIKDIETAVRLTEKKGKTVKPATMEKIKTFDKWIVREILDYMEDKDTNTPAAPVAAATIIAEIKEETPPAATATTTPAVETPPAEKKPEETPVDAEGVICDKEFAEMLKAGKAEVTLDELKTLAPTAYGIIFKHHTNDLTNGITTTYYVLSEVTTNNFKLVKK